MAQGTVIFYSTFAGIKGVTATDVIQFGVLIVAIPIVFNVGIKSAGGFDAVFKSVPAKHLSLFPTEESIQRYIPLILIFITYSVNPALIQRFLMARNLQQASKAFRATSIISIPFFIITGLIGLTAYCLKPGLDSSLALLKPSSPWASKELPSQGCSPLLCPRQTPPAASPSFTTSSSPCTTKSSQNHHRTSARTAHHARHWLSRHCRRTELCEYC